MCPSPFRSKGDLRAPENAASSVEAFLLPVHTSAGQASPSSLLPSSAEPQRDPPRLPGRLPNLDTLFHPKYRSSETGFTRLMAYDGAPCLHLLY